MFLSDLIVTGRLKMLMLSEQVDANVLVVVHVSFRS